MAMTPEPEGLPRTAARTRQLLRYATAALSSLVGVLYLVLLFLVLEAESRPDAVVTDTTYGAYLFLAIPYVVGAVVAVVSDRFTLWLLGAVVQVLVIVLFVLFGVGAFEYEALSGLRMEWWAAVITGAQLVLLGLLGYLAFTRRHGAAPAPSEPPGARQPS